MTRSFHAGRPFNTPTADIAAALEQVSIPTLLLSLVHLTGDPRYIHDFKQAGLFLNEVQGFMSEEDKARARAEALPVIVDYRDRGCPVPDPLPDELVREMLDWAACAPVDADNLPLVLEELDLEGTDPRRPVALDPERAKGFHVIVIGCGESGVLAGVRLKQAGLPFTIVEKNAGPRGTCWENSYPGARVDVANHFYCYSFEPSNHWDHFFAEQPELRQYFRDVVDRHELEPRIRSCHRRQGRAPDGVPAVTRAHPCLTRAVTAGNPTDRVGASVDQALVFQERRRRDPYRQPVAAQRISFRHRRTRVVGLQVSGGVSMRAVVVDSSGQVSVVTRPDPVLPGPDGAIVKVDAASICGSDLHFLEGHYPIFEPITVGHEAVGTIVEIGSEVTIFAVGDRVLVSSVAGCGQCAGCATLDPIRCVHGPQIFGSGVLGGAQAEFLAVPAAQFQLLARPENISTEQALLLTDNLATGWAAAKRADIPIGGTVAVIGLGAVGMCALRSALTLGAARVFAVDPVEARRRRAQSWGAVGVTPPSAQPVREATGGLGADAVIDAVGSDASINDAIETVRTGGTVSIVGVHDLQPYPMPALACLIRSLTIRLTTAPVQQTWPELVPLLQAGRLDVDGIFTTAFPLDAAADGYAAALTRSGEHLKIRLNP